MRFRSAAIRALRIAASTLFGTSVWYDSSLTFVSRRGMLAAESRMSENHSTAHVEGTRDVLRPRRE